MVDLFSLSIRSSQIPLSLLQVLDQFDRRPCPEFGNLNRKYQILFFALTSVSVRASNLNQ